MFDGCVLEGLVAFELQGVGHLQCFATGPYTRREQGTVVVWRKSVGFVVFLLCFQRFQQNL